MSGEPVALLVSQPSGTLVALVRALAELESAGLPRHALIGGVAVMVRLSQSHRATQDLDEVVEPSLPTAAVLIAGPGAVEHRAETAGGVRVDLISVGDRDLRSLQASDLPDQDDERLFALAHDFALRSAEPALIRVIDRGGGILVESTSPSRRPPLCSRPSCNPHPAGPALRRLSAAATSTTRSCSWTSWDRLRSPTRYGRRPTTSHLSRATWPRDCSATRPSEPCAGRHKPASTRRPPG